MMMDVNNHPKAKATFLPKKAKLFISFFGGIPVLLI
jgi:hypothetical protein